VFQDPVSDHPDVAACLQKLHDFGAFAGHLCPTRFGLRVLFQASKFNAVDFKINLRRAMFGGAPYGEGRVAESYNFLLFHERLTPPGEKDVIDGGRGVGCSHQDSLNGREILDSTTGPDAARPLH
jgi:hypothetical protein